MPPDSLQPQQPRLHQPPSMQLDLQDHQGEAAATAARGVVGAQEAAALLATRSVLELRGRSGGKPARSNALSPLEQCSLSRKRVKALLQPQRLQRRRPPLLRLLQRRQLPLLWPLKRLFAFACLW